MGIQFLSTLEYDSLLELIRPLDTVHNAWVVGGALLRYDSKDIDVVLHTDSVQGSLKLCHVLCGDVWEIQKVCDVYSKIDVGKDLIIKLVPKDRTLKVRPVDLLVASNQMNIGISKYMHKYFPLDIQEVAVSLMSGVQCGIVKTDPCIIMLNEGFDDGKYLAKYKKYYPDAKFMQEV